MRCGGIVLLVVVVVLSSCSGLPMSSLSMLRSSSRVAPLMSRLWLGAGAGSLKPSPSRLGLSSTVTRCLRMCSPSLTMGEGSHGDFPQPVVPAAAAGDMEEHCVEVEVASPAAMEALGAVLGEGCGEGDVILLHGDLGSGKTCFSRGFIRACIEDPTAAVTSPSYLLDNTFDTPDGELILHHMDLYRLAGPSDLRILGIPEVFSNTACLIEWPDRLGDLTPEERLDVTIDVLGEMKRKVTLLGRGDLWVDAISKVLEGWQWEEEDGS
ncbi:unnamed protein product [Chrysoparadoxa australica]